MTTSQRILLLFIHLILAGVTIGLAQGMHDSPGHDIVATYTVIGLAAGLGLSAFIHLGIIFCEYIDVPTPGFW